MLQGTGAERVPIVIVSGPAGAGESVLARQALEADDREQLELPLVGRLDEAAALSGAVVDLMETVGAPAPNLRSSITAAEPRFTTIVLPALARLAASRTREYVLVVDDVQLLRDRACQDIVRTLCEATPPGSQVVLLSRDATPPWLARARAEGRLLEISDRDLRFDVFEATELFRRLEVIRDARTSRTSRTAPRGGLSPSTLRASRWGTTRTQAVRRD